MDNIISLLQNLLSLNKLASVSLPGFFYAIAVAILLWPARPIDEIPTVRLKQPARQQITNEPCPKGALLPKEPVCPKKTKPLPDQPFFNKAAAKESQRDLDQEKQNIAECVEEETRLKGFEKSQNDYWTQDIVDLQKLVTAELETYSTYEKTNNPLAEHFLAKWKAHQDEMLCKRNLILHNEQSVRDRDRNLAELARFDKIISDRLADPGRLRPRRTFDDVLIALVNHVTGFILLAIVLGVVVTPMAQAGSASFFDMVFPGGF